MKDRNHIKSLSYCLNSVLRHYGCTAGGVLACDSGGWYKFDDLIQQFDNPYVDENGNHLYWYKAFKDRIRDPHLLKYMDWRSWVIALWKAQEPDTRQPPRYQIVMEWDPHESEDVFARPHAVLGSQRSSQHRHSGSRVTCSNPEV
jgi:hypothetical protein